MDMKIELIPIPVTDVDRAKAFYVDQVGFHADHDGTPYEGLRFVQLTPPGSARSIVLGQGVTEMAPGSVNGYLMVVTDAAKAREELLGRGVDVSELDPREWSTFAHFKDPDGNAWSLQQLPKRG